MESVHRLLELFRSGALSPVEAMQSALDRIEQYDPGLNAFRVVDAERAMEAATSSAKRWSEGNPCGPLDGVPISVKDTLMAKGFAFRQGSLVTENTPSPRSAPVVERCEEAGAIVIGITTCPEFGSSSLTVSPLTGATVNPYDKTKHAGGSSGGAAVSVAAGMVPLALGSDAGGSARTPASFCGIVGFKPSGSLVPAFPRNVGGPLSSPGILCHSVEDAMRTFGLVAQPDTRDVEAVAPLETHLEAADGLRGLRIAFSKTLGYVSRLDPGVEKLVSKAVETCEGLGAVVEERDPGFEDPENILRFHLAAGYAHILRHLLPEQLDLLTPSLRALVIEGRTYSSLDYLAAQDERLDLGRRMAAFHADVDLLITPTLPVPAFDIGATLPEEFASDSPPRSWTSFVYPFNLTQQPAISLPCGLTESGLPAGVQMVGRRRSDATVLRSALAYEQAVGPFPLAPLD